MLKRLYRGLRAYPRTIHHPLTSQPTPLPPKSSPPIQRSSKSSWSVNMARDTPSPNGSTLPNEPMLIRFYSPVDPGKDMYSRTLSSILAWDDSQLEHSHNYIQVLFPLPEGSLYNFSAPVVDRRVFEAFRSRPELQDTLRLSFKRILKFYGFSLKDNTDGSEPEVVKLPSFSTVSRHWVTRFNHNHLRITRIIRSLRVLGLEREAEAFFVALKQVYDECNGRIGQKSMLFWSRAISRPLFLAPEDEEDEGNRVDFLYEFERGNR